MPNPADAPLNELLRAAQNGDQCAFEVLLTRYSPLIDSLSTSYAQDPSNAEDFRQEACIAFCKAVQHYDTQQCNVQFGLYAKICIRNRLISYMRHIHTEERVVSLNDEITTDDTTDPARAITEEEDYLTLYRRIESLLSPYENRVWWLYLSGRTAKEIATLSHKDERSVQNAIYRIRKKLRSALPSP